MKIKQLENIDKLAQYLSLTQKGKIFENDIHVENSRCDANCRKTRDAEVLTTIAANATGNILEIGTSYGKGTFKLSTNLPKPNKVYTVNILPEQCTDKEEFITHLLTKKEIGSFYIEKNCQNVIQIYANTLDWEPDDELNNIAFTFIDGGHDRHTVYNDSKISWERLKPGGYLAWHDFNPDLRHQFKWIETVMLGIEDFLKEYGIQQEIIHLKNSWIGIIRKTTQKPMPLAKDIKLGIVIDWEFHKADKWVCALTPELVDALIYNFDSTIIQNQKQYETVLPEIDALISFEPGWSAPIFNYVATEKIAKQKASIPSYIFYSDFHNNKWREEYFFSNTFTKIAAYYYYPALHHFKKITSNHIIHMPWSIPDEWISYEPIINFNQKKLCCFGASSGDAYTLRNWVRSFSFIHNAQNSGCQNKEMNNKDFFKWLKQWDAIVAAGSDDNKYQLALPKYFEAAANGSLLFAHNVPDLKPLGFIHNKNCILFNKDNFIEVTQKYFKDTDAFLAIRSSGREFIRRRHSLSARMRFLTKEIRKEIISKEPKKIKSSYSLDARFNFFFHKICIPEVLEYAKNNTIQLNNYQLTWEIMHEIFAYHIFDKTWPIKKIIDYSKNRYAMLDKLWPGQNACEESIKQFYIDSHNIVPWGHGVFVADGNILSRRKEWLRRVDILQQIKNLGANTILDYGAGAGHTSLTALAMGFDTVGHLEYDIFHPFIKWRLDNTPTLDSSRFIFASPDNVDIFTKKFDAIICSDVPEHVYDYNKLLRQLQSLLQDNGILVWISLFGDGISSHLHPELQGQETKLLNRYGFKKIANCNAQYAGYSGIFKYSNPH